MSSSQTSTARSDPRVQQRALRAMMDNPTGLLEDGFDPTHCETFTLRTWATLLRQDQAKRQIEEDRLAAAADEASAARSVFQNDEAERKRKEEEEAMKRRNRNTDVLAGIQSEEADGDEIEAPTHSHLRVGHSAILSAAKPPQLRHARQDKLSYRRGLETIDQPGHHEHTASPGVASRPSPTFVEDTPPIADHDGTQDPAATPAPSATPLLDRLKALERQRQQLDGSEGSQTIASVPSPSSQKVRHSTIVRPTTNRFRGGGGDSDPTAELYVAEEPVVGPEGKRQPAATTSVLGFKQPLYTIDHVHYDELYREQLTLTAAMLAQDEAYKILVDSLDQHMASVAFTFKAMLEGDFILDEAKKKDYLANRERVLSQHYRSVQTGQRQDSEDEGGEEGDEEAAARMAAERRAAAAARRRRMSIGSPLAMTDDDKGSSGRNSARGGASAGPSSVVEAPL